MPTGSETPRGLHWTWTPEERRRLLGRFQGGLYRLLRAVERWGADRDGSHAPVLRSLADGIEAAGTDLDVCAANCHALATTLRAQAGMDGNPAVPPHAALRLGKALGSPVVLTRTTIEQLAGKTLRLEYIEGANAIVQVNGEYWGTPLDRVLVLDDEGDHSDDADADASALPAAPPPPRASSAPAFTFALRRGELSNAIQFLTMTARTGVLTVSCTAVPDRGVLLLDSRRVTHAEFGAYRDVDAVARLMNVGTSQAAFEDGTVPDEGTIQLSTDQLLIEAAVRADELIQMVQ